MAYRAETRLADGRVLYYFDAEPGIVRDAKDTRDLPRTQTASEIRWDPLLDQWVVIASHRQGRSASCRRPTSARSTRPGTAGRPRSRPTTTRSWSSRTGSPRWPPPRCSARTRTTCDRTTTRCSPAAPGSAGARWSASPATTRPRSPRCAPERVDTVFDAWVDRTRDLNAMPRGRAGLRVREPGRGDRGHALPPARADLRLSVRPAADAPPARVGRAGTGSVPGECLHCVAARRRARAPAPGSSPRTTWSPSSSRTPPVAVRGARLPAPARPGPAGARPTRSAPRVAEGLPGPAAAVRRASSRRRRRTSPPGCRRRPGTTAS